jgi:hypothetical protein
VAFLFQMRENPNFITSVITSTTKRDSAASMSARMMAMGFQGVRDFCVTKGSLLPPSFDSPEDLLHTLFGFLEHEFCITKCVPQPVQVPHDLLTRAAAHHIDDLGAIFMD